MNPTHSVKDRIGLAMILDAEQRGHLKPGGTIVEATSGNTGTGLAMVAAVTGYRSVLVMPDKVSREKINLLKAFGAEVVIAPTSVPPDSPDSYYEVAKRIVRETPGAFPEAAESEDQGRRSRPDRVDPQGVLLYEEGHRSEAV
jgi:cystathionine beta-synthase